MNFTSQNHNWESGNWLAFFFGAIFNLFAQVSPSLLLDYTLKAVIGGIICLGFKLLGDHINAQKKQNQKPRRPKKPWEI